MAIATPAPDAGSCTNEVRRDPDRRPDDEGHIVRGSELDERRETRVVLRKREMVGEVQLVAGQRQLGKHEGTCALFRGGVDESNVAFEVGADVSAVRNRFGRPRAIDRLPWRPLHTPATTRRAI